MKSVLLSATIGCILLAASLFEWRWRPADALTQAKPAVAAMTGVIGLLLALVLHLLISTSFGVFAGQQSEALALSPLVAELDLLLEQCGPKAAPGRAGLKAALQGSKQRFFGDESGPRMLSFEKIKATRAGMYAFFGHATAPDEARRNTFQKTRELAKRFHDTQIAMLTRLASPFPGRVLDIVAFWATILPLGDEFLSPFSGIAFVAHLFGALGLATTVFLILELSQPYSGVIRLSGESLERGILALEGQEAFLAK